MSGGHFDYAQYKIEGIASMVDELISSNDDQTKDQYGDIIGRGYTLETIERFKEAVHNLRRAEEMVQRVDWLVSCDDGEDSFHSRWAEEVRDEYS